MENTNKKDNFLPSVKVVGRISIPNVIRNPKEKYQKCVCDYCGSVSYDRFGDPRVEVKVIDSKNKTTIKRVCVTCEWYV
jgi:transcription initiation factor TFIIIB Brf1 subunit/transcription initiation factor TFIIB